MVLGVAHLKDCSREGLPFVVLVLLAVFVPLQVEQPVTLPLLLGHSLLLSVLLVVHDSSCMPPIDAAGGNTPRLLDVPS